MKALLLFKASLTATILLLLALLSFDGPVELSVGLPILLSFVLSLAVTIYATAVLSNKKKSC